MIIYYNINLLKIRVSTIFDYKRVRFPPLPIQKKNNKKEGERGEYIISRKKGKDSYIYKQGKKYVISKKIPPLNKNIYFGTFPDKETARKYRDFLEKHNWDTKYIKRHRKKWTPQGGNDSKYISFNTSTNKWVVQYCRDGRHYYFGCYNSFEEAREERDFWNSIDWDIDLLDLY